MLLLKAAWRYKRDGFGFFFHPFFLSCMRIFFFRPVARYPNICVTCKAFIKGKVKLCSGNGSFCRSVPKVKPLNQRSVILPKPLLSCRGRNENCTSKTTGRLCSEGSARCWDASGLSSWLRHSSSWPTLGKSLGDDVSRLLSWGCSFSAPQDRWNLCALLEEPQSKGVEALGRGRTGHGTSHA